MTDRREASARGVATLLSWAAGAAPGALPADIRRRAALVLADDIGAIVVAARNAPVLGAQADLCRAARIGEATIFAPGAPQADRCAAAAANGIAATWCELDEGFRRAPCHAGAYAIPALLAEAEAADLPLSRVLAALALAYEVAGRCAMAFPFAVMTVHPHAAFATIGAAAGAGLARGCDAGILTAAVSGAASMTFAGPFNHAVDGVMVRNAWTSAGAWIGMQAVDWALRGIGGVPAALHDVFVGVLGTGADPAALTEGLGERWAIADGYHKVFACCQYAHSAVEASLGLHARLKAEALAADDIAAITVETHPRGETLTTVEPATDLAARFSLPHAAAATAVLGGCGQEAFSAEALADPAIARLRRAVTLRPHPAIGPPPEDRPARVTWTLRDGRRWVADRASARGGADQPFDEATLRAKLVANTAAEFPAMAETLWRIVEGAASPEMPWRDVVKDMTAR